MNDLEIIFSEKFFKRVTFNLDKNTVHNIPKEDPSRDGSQWILDSLRRRYKLEDDGENVQLTSGNG